MGLYANHGVEYHVVYIGKIDVIAAMKDTDARLLASKYYQKHKSTWLVHETMYMKGSFVIAIDDPDFDVGLTEEEKTVLERALTEKEGLVECHGWYEVNTITSSL